MKALFVTKPEQYELTDVPKPVPVPGWALIRVLCAAFCATDLELLCGGIPARYPIIPGHEWCGVVEAVNGSGHEWLGKRVSGSNDVCCLVCNACRSGLWRECPAFGEIGFAHDGAYAEYMCVPIYALRELPASISDIQATMLEPLGVALGTLDKMNARLGETLLILGAGSVGLNMLAAAKAAGLRKITVVERSGGRMEIAREMGAEHVMASNDCDIEKELKSIYPTGPDIIIECTGAESCIQLAFSIAPKGGRIGLAGYSRKQNINLKIDDAHIKNLRITGAGNNWNLTDRCIDLINDGIITTERLCTHISSLSQFDKAVKIATERPAGFVKTIFDMSIDI